MKKIYLVYVQPQVQGHMKYREELPNKRVAWKRARQIFGGTSKCETTVVRKIGCIEETLGGYYIQYAKNNIDYKFIKLELVTRGEGDFGYIKKSTARGQKMKKHYLVYIQPTARGNASMPEPEEFTNKRKAWERARQLSGGDCRNDTTVVAAVGFTKTILGGYLVIYEKNGIDFKIKKFTDEDEE